MSLCVRMVCALLVAASSTVWSAEIEHLSVVRKGRTFETTAVFFVDVPRESLVRTATDFERIASVNPAVVRSTVEHIKSGEVRVTTTLRDCVSAVCRTVELVEDVQRLAGDVLLARVVPDAGDFASGQSTWHFDAHGGGTRVRYRGAIRPRFWVPRLIGSGAFKKSLRRQVRATAERLEALSTAELKLPLELASLGQDRGAAMR